MASNHRIHTAFPDIVVSNSLQTVLQPMEILGRNTTTTTKNIFITIPDLTRPLDVLPPLQQIRTYLQNDPTIMIGLGLHRNMTPVELQSLKGFSVEQHNPDDVTYINQKYL